MGGVHNPHGREKSEYVLKAGHDFFPKATWVQLHAIYEQDWDTMLQHGLSGRMREMQQLRPETIGAIANCAARCDDVSEYHRQLICRKARQ
jgi:hypothetical protein